MNYISRQIEKTYRNLLFRRHDPDGSVFYFSHNDFPGLVGVEYSFNNKRGNRLYGKFYYYENPKPGRLIVFEHGMGNGHNAYFREIETLAKQGYLVYSYDHTGCNNSEGDHIYGLSGSLSDLDDCITALVTEKGFSESQISVVGHSWGGYSALNILAYHPNLQSIVAISGFISVKTMQHQAIPFVLAPFRKRLFAMEKRANPKYADSSAIKVLAKANRPVLVIHSMDDRTVSYKSNLETLSRLLVDKDNISYLLVAGSGHSPQYTPEAFALKEKCFADLKKLRKSGLLKFEENRHAFLLQYDWLAMTEQNDELWGKIFLFLEGKPFTKNNWEI